MSNTVTVKRDGEYRVTLRLSRIKELRPDYSHKQACDRAESLAYYTNDQQDAIATAMNMDAMPCLPDLFTVIWWEGGEGYEPGWYWHYTDSTELHGPFNTSDNAELDAKGDF